MMLRTKHNFRFSTFLAMCVVVPGLLGGASTPTFAQGKQQRLAVFVTAGGSAKGSMATLARRLQTTIRTQIGSFVGVRVVTGSPVPRTNILAQIRPQVERGFRALNDRKGAKAEPLFKSAYDRLIRYTGPFDRRLMARVTKGLGVAYAMTGKDRSARQMMRKCLNLWPDQESSEYAYTLDVRNTFKAVQKIASAAKKGSINLASDPPGAVIWLAGKMKGHTPFTVTDVAAGPHWVSVQLDGFRRTGTFVDVAPGKVAGHSLALQEVPNVQAYNSLIKGVEKGFKRAKRVQPALKNLQGFLGADGVLYLRLSARKGLTLNGWYKPGAGPAKSLKGTFAADADLVANIKSWLAASLGRKVAPKEDPLPLDAPPQASVVIGGADSVFIDPNDPILATPEKKVRDPITGKWWFWVIVGGAAAGVATLVAVLLGEQGQARGPVGNLSIKLHRQE